MDPQISLPGTPHRDMPLQDPVGLWSSFKGHPFPAEDPPSQVGEMIQHGWHGSSNAPKAVFMSPEQAYYPSQQPHIESRNPKQRARSPQTARQSSKRQKVAPLTPADEDDPFEGSFSQSGSESTCCSSCPDSPPCAEPDCNLDIVVTCTEKSCAVPACTDPCLDIATQNQRSIADQARRLANWDNSGWTPQSPRPFSQRSSAYAGDISDPNLRGFDRHEYSTGDSPYSNPPSMINNDLPTPYSPHTSLPTPQSGIYQPTYNDVLSGAGSLFHPSTDAFSGQGFGLSQSNNGSFTFDCRWDGCGQTSFLSQDEWIPHFHQQHLDPQLTFRCPIPGQDCAPDIGFNIFDHLENDHGYNFLNESFSCPAPTCDPTEKFCDPSLLHNHFDHAHAIPTEGVLQCRLDACNAGFTDPVQFFSHINDFHDLPIPLSSLDNIDLALPSHESKPLLRQKPSLPKIDLAPQKTPKMDLSDQGPPHCCKWVDGVNVCGKVCSSEVDLQTHITNDHLNSLDKTSGYNCQWHGCGRRDKRGEKSGFSQRGKLERHMATHTGYKCATCDICGKTFSAEQSMKQHRLLHTGAKPWKCQYCHKSFPQQSACTIHERTHTKAKPLTCNICGKAFSESSNLSKHRKIHGEKGMHCCSYPGCSKSFHRLDQLKRHGIVHSRAEEKMGRGLCSESESGIAKTEESELGSEG